MLNLYINIYIYIYVPQNSYMFRSFLNHLQGFDIVCTVHRNQLYKQNAPSVSIYSTTFSQLYMFRTTISFIIRSSQFTVSAAGSNRKAE